MSNMQRSNADSSAGGGDITLPFPASEYAEGLRGAKFGCGPFPVNARRSGSVDDRLSASSRCSGALDRGPLLGGLHRLLLEAPAVIVCLNDAAAVEFHPLLF